MRFRGTQNGVIQLHPKWTRLTFEMLDGEGAFDRQLLNFLILASLKEDSPCFRDLTKSVPASKRGEAKPQRISSCAVIQLEIPDLMGTG